MKQKWTADRIKAVRKARGERQEDFAKHFRLSAGAIQKWEQDEGDPSGPAQVILDQMEAGIFDERMSDLTATAS